MTASWSVARALTRGKRKNKNKEEVLCPSSFYAQNTNSPAHGVREKFAFVESDRSRPAQKSDCALDLVGTEASCTDVYMAGGTVNDCFYTFNVGLPSSVGASVRMGNLNAERYALAANIALCQIAAPPIVIEIVQNDRCRKTPLCIISEFYQKSKRKFTKKYIFFRIRGNGCENVENRL